MHAVPTTILIATDGTPTSAVALEAAGDIAVRTGADLHLLHVWGDPYAGIAPSQGVTEAGEHAAEETALGVAARERARVQNLGVGAARAHTARGIRGEVTVRTAARLHAGLIVVGARQPSVLTDMLTTRVSRAVVGRTRAPVLVVPVSAHWPPARVIAAIEDVADVEALAPLASWLAATLGVDLHFTHVVRPPAEEVAAETRALLEAMLEQGWTSSVPRFEMSILRGGSVARTLLDASRGDGPGVLVLGAREVRRWLREGREDVALDVARHSYGPLLLVPERIRINGAHEVGGRTGAAEPALR